MNKMIAIRGATTIENDSVDQIRIRSVELAREIIAKNGIKKGECVSLIASQTQDIRAAYPVKFVRESGIIGDTPVFSCVEPDVGGGSPPCIRFLLHIQREDDGSFRPRHVYLHGAKILRRDLENE